MGVGGGRGLGQVGSGSECESLIEERVRGVSSGWVGFASETYTGSELFAISRSCLTLRGAVPLESARPQMSKHQIQKHDYYTSHRVQIPQGPRQAQGKEQ